MVFVKWEEYGICRFWALSNTTCQFPDSCKWAHPPTEEVDRIWAAHASGKQQDIRDQYRRLPSSVDFPDRGRRSLDYGSAYDNAPAPENEAMAFENPYDQRRVPPRPFEEAALPLPSREGVFYDHPPWGRDEMDWDWMRQQWQTPRHDHHERPVTRQHYEEAWRGELSYEAAREFDPHERQYSPHMLEHRETSYPPRSVPLPSAVANRGTGTNRNVYEPPPGMDPKTGQQPGQHFDPARSSNAFVNGNMVYRFVWGEPLCVRCGSVGHLPRQCHNPPLSEAEQSYLYTLMRKEQNRSKEEKGLLTKDPTARLAPLPPRPSSRPSTRDSSWHPQSSASTVDSSYWDRHRARQEPDPLLKSEDEIMAINAQTVSERDSMVDGKRPEPPQWAPPKPSYERETMIRRADGADAHRKENDVNAEMYVKAEGKREAMSKSGPQSSDVTLPGRDSSMGDISLPTTSPAISLLQPSAPAFVPYKTDALVKFRMGATKRMSNGEAKVIGPHPSTIRVSASYMTQAAIDKRLQSEGLDAQERSVAEAREDSVRLQGVAWLDNVRRALQLPVKTFTTACVYYHKFRLAHPKEEYNWTDAAAASLLTSCKNEDTLKKSRDILAAAHNMKQVSAHEQVGADDPMFEAQSRMVIGLERLILESGGFDFRSRAPHHTLVKISKSLPQSPELREVAQLAWTILTDIHRTWAPLKQTSSALALACLEVAAHFKAAKSATNTCAVREDLQDLDLRRWHTTREEVMETLLDALDLYTHTSSATILGNRYSLDDLLRIRLALNKECTESNLPRYTAVQPPPSPDHTNGTSSTLRVANGHPTPISPPQAGTQVSQQPNTTTNNQPTPDGGGTLRFMLNPQRATEERAKVNRYYTEEWEDYEEEIEVPLPRDRSREPHRDRDRDRDRPTGRDRNVGRSRDHDDGRGIRESRDSPRQPAVERGGHRDRTRDRDHEAEPERSRARSRDRERRYDERRPYEDRERGKYERGDRRNRDRDGRYYDDDLRRERR